MKDPEGESVGDPVTVGEIVGLRVGVRVGDVETVAV